MSRQSENTIISFLLPNRIAGGGAADSPGSPPGARHLPARCPGPPPSVPPPTPDLFPSFCSTFIFIVILHPTLCSSLFYAFLIHPERLRLTAVNSFPGISRENEPSVLGLSLGGPSSPAESGIVVRIAAIFLATSLQVGSGGCVDRAIHEAGQKKSRRVRPRAQGAR